MLETSGASHFVEYCNYRLLQSHNKVVRFKKEERQLSLLSNETRRQAPSQQSAVGSRWLVRRKSRYQEKVEAARHRLLRRGKKRGELRVLYHFQTKDESERKHRSLPSSKCRRAKWHRIPHCDYWARGCSLAPDVISW